MGQAHSAALSDSLQQRLPEIGAAGKASHELDIQRLIPYVFGSSQTWREGVEMKRAMLAAAMGMMLACAAALAGEGQGFTVTKNVNSGKPPVEKVVLFEKGKGAGQLSLEGSPKFTVAEDGSLVLPVVGHDLVQPIIRWKEGDGRPASFDPSQYTFLILRMSFEGDVKTTMPNGKVTTSRPDNLWFSLGLYDAKDQRAGLVGLAEVAEDSKTPSRMVTLKVPLTLFAKSRNPAVDVKHINGIGFYWDKTRETANRDFKLVIEKIALAD
jgi:hypothetical protein